MRNRLESIELQGLKTFATITRLEFPGKITAIVGPNGSGKSNIADAIRWVLGEQSYSLLRAKRTEDMIFSGSQQRSRAGMASSTIIFNNEDGWLPIDYSEVAITRQAYRDGQNEYLLNGQKVRLKDISELLSQTGLSERNYTIIGQGLVDAALALKPDERRKLFEEAAGIGLYRSRKEESLRRLEHTRKNLDRVLDILTEIKPRLRSLERQSERYQEYQRVQSDLQHHLREWYGYQWHQKQQDLRIIRNAYQDQENRLLNLRKKYADAEAKVEQIRSVLQVNRKALEGAHHVLSDNHQQLEKATRELAIIEERQRSYNHQKGNLEIDIANLQEEINGLESQASVFEGEIEQRQSEYRSASDEAQRIEQQLSVVSQQKDQAESELETARNARLTYETEKVQLIARIEELINRIESLKDEREKILQSMETLKGDLGDKHTTVATLEKSLEALQSQDEDLKSKIADHSEKIKKVNTEREMLEQSQSYHETQQSKIQTQLNLLQQAESALSGYSEGSKTLVEISRKGRLPQGIEPLSQHMLVEEKFERAISAALGELTDLLVMPSSSKEILIEYLEAKENERVALVALDRAHPHEQNKQLLAMDGVLGYANELIHVEPSYQRLIDNLFSDILIVKDAKTAQRVQSSLEGTQKAVTLSGLVFHTNGLLISGQSPSGKRIGRTRQQSELLTQLGVHEKEIAEVTQKKLLIVETRSRLEADRVVLANEQSQLENDKNVLSRELQNVKDDLTRLRGQLSWHEDRIAAIDENLKKAASLVKSGEDELDNLENQIGTFLSDEKRLLSNLNDISLFEVQQELNHWQTHQIVTQNALHSAQQRYDDHLNRIDTARQRLDTLQSRIKELSQNLLENKEQKEALNKTVIEIQDQIKIVESEQILPLSFTNEETERTVSALQKLEAHSHQQVIIAERQYTQLQLELGRRQDQVEHLRERIADDFGLVSFDAEQKYDGPTPLPFNGNLIENLPRIQDLPETHEDEIKRLKNQMRRIGAINPEALQEYIEVKERFEFLNNQINDLEKASQDLQEVIRTLDDMMERDFLKTFKAVNQEFSKYFSRLFNGGEAKLVVSDDENPVEGGVDIEARLPGRRQQGLALLSGGERSLTAVALIFALLKVSPPPFCILDEVDAMLDESNVGRFVDVLLELAQTIQVVIITHNRNTVQAADIIYGVTMGRDSTSQMISLKLEDVGDTYFE